jgi:hypothetical protein
MPYASQGVNGFDDNKNCAVLSCGHCIFLLPIRVRGSKNVIIDFLSRTYTRNCSVSEIYFTYTILLDFDPLQPSDVWCLCSNGLPSLSEHIKGVRERKKVDLQIKIFRINQNNETVRRRTKEWWYASDFPCFRRGGAHSIPGGSVLVLC